MSLEGCSMMEEGRFVELGYLRFICCRVAQCLFGIIFLNRMRRNRRTLRIWSNAEENSV